ncbi:MAG: O-antigen ligase family protein, partial [Candidatus Binatia bacterium]
QQFAKTIVITYLLASLITDAREFRLALVVIALSLGFEATKQGWSQLILNPGGKNFNPVPFLGDENGVAVGMLMLMPVLGVLGQTTEQPWARFLYRFMAVGVFYRAISTWSRGGFISALALGAIYLIRSPQRVRSLLGILIAAAITLPAFPDEFWDRMSTITPHEEEMDDSAKGRVHYWRVGLSMANDNPLTGVGHKAYDRAYDQYDFLSGEFGRRRSAHSTWFGVLGELGYPGLFLFALNVFSALRACGRARRLAVAIGNDELRRYAIAIETGLGVFFVGGSFVVFQYTEMLWHFIGLSIALEAIAAKAAEAETRSEESVPEPAAAAASGF